MSTKKKTVEEPTIITREGDNGVTARVVVSVLPAKRRVPFAVWANVARIPEPHKAGMMAFVSHPEINRTIETWYSLFDGY
jgi:hypothetical protein